jgi:ribose transport system substrate-binding protein
MVPGLRTAGVNPKDAIISTADGQKDAYVRIASGDQYWTAVVAEPLEAEGYHVVDELNRAFNNQPPSGYVEKPYVVTRDNMDKAGGPKSMYIPENDYAKNYRKVWGLSQ